MGILVVVYFNVGGGLIVVLGPADHDHGEIIRYMWCMYPHKKYMLMHVIGGDGG